MGDVGSRRWYRETLPHRAWGIRKHFLPGHVKCHVCVCQGTKWNVHYVSSEKGKWTQAKGVPQTQTCRDARPTVVQPANRPVSLQICGAPDDTSRLSPSFIACVLCSQYLREAFPCGSAWQRRTRAPHFGPAHQMHDQLPSLNGGWCSGCQRQTYPLIWPILVSAPSYQVDCDKKWPKVNDKKGQIPKI